MRDRTVRALWVGGGAVALGLGVVGVFVPVLPTVPLVLLAAACFARGSERAHRWLREHRHFGPLVRAYGSGRVPRRARNRALVLLWVTIGLTAGLVVRTGWLRVLLVAIAAAVSAYLLRLPTDASPSTPGPRGSIRTR
ncbi:YbaN family protein [Deferrisoma sp.]